VRTIRKEQLEAVLRLLELPIDELTSFKVRDFGPGLTGNGLDGCSHDNLELLRCVALEALQGMTDATVLS
jgi:hypothetical protein